MTDVLEPPESWADAPDLDAKPLVKKALPREDGEPAWKSKFHLGSELEDGEPRVFVRGFLEEGITALGSLSGVGKTYSALSLARALRTGRPLFGTFEVVEKANVLYLCPEMGSRAFKKRLKKMHIDLDDEGFRCQTIRDGVCNLSDPDLLEAIQTMKPVVFLDTAIRFSKAMDENSSSQHATGTATAIYELMRAGAVAVVVLHHSPKLLSESESITLENTLRGTGDWGAMCDSVWAIVHARKRKGKGWDPDFTDESKSLTRLRFQNVKPRDMEPVDPFVVQGRPHIDENGDFVVLALDADEFDVANVPTTDEGRRAAMLDAIRKDAKVSINALRKLTGWGHDTVKSAVGEAGYYRKTGRWEKAEKKQPTLDEDFSKGTF